MRIIRYTTHFTCDLTWQLLYVFVLIKFNVTRDQCTVISLPAKLWSQWNLGLFKQGSYVPVQHLLADGYHSPATALARKPLSLRSLMMTNKY